MIIPKKFNKPIIFSLLFFIFSLTFCSSLKMYFIDVKEGDATFIITPTSKTILIDTGNDYFDSGKYIYDFILSKNFNKIDFLIISHPHRDHIGGAVFLLLNMEVKNFYHSSITSNYEIYYKVLDIIKDKKINYKIIKENDNIKVEPNIDIFVLNPPKDLYKSVNNNSIVLKISYKNISVLFTGDIEKKAERDIIRRFRNTKILKSDILKVPHHGSNTSSTDEFIKEVSPKVAVIFCGIKNRYGHPHLEVLQRYRKYGIKIFRTDLDGTIELITDGKIFKINSYKR